MSILRMGQMLFLSSVPDTELVLYPLQDKLNFGDKSLDLSAFKLSRQFFSLLSSGSSSCWRLYGAQLRLRILKNMTVEEVINEFDKLRMRCDVVEEEEQVVARFLGVFKPEIADIVSLQPYWTYTDVCRLALKVEKQIKSKSKGFTSRFTSRFTPPTRTSPPTAPKTTPKATTPITSTAGNTRERVDNAPRCYKCGGLRHYARDCPNLKTLAFVPDDACPIYDIDAEPELDEPGDELVYPDRSPLFWVGAAAVVSRCIGDVADGGGATVLVKAAGRRCILRRRRCRLRQTNLVKLSTM
ncbi:reverse transcriptase domain-containing protein [Tanacetum coccineum]